MLPCSVCRNRKLVFRKLWQSEDCTYGCGVCGVTPARDVTTQMMTTANAGTRVAAGVSSRCLGLAAWMFEKLHEGSVGQVGSVACFQAMACFVSKETTRCRCNVQGKAVLSRSGLVSRQTVTTTKDLTERGVRRLQ